MLLPRVALAAVVSALCCLMVTAVVWWTGDRGPGDVTAPGAGPTPVEVVRAWDARRAQAWADGDADALGALYTPGAAVGRRDVAMLETYAARGLVVEGLTTQLLAVEEVHADDDTWVLEVADRVHGGTVVGEGVRRDLPRDGVDRRRLTLRRDGETWRVASVVKVAGDGADSGGQAG